MSPLFSGLHTIRLGLLSLLLGLSLPVSSWADEAQALYNKALSHIQRQDFQQAARGEWYEGLRIVDSSFLWY